MVSTQDQVIIFPYQPPLARAGKAAVGAKRKKASTDDAGGAEVPAAAAAKKHKTGAAPPVEDEGELFGRSKNETSLMLTRRLCHHPTPCSS